MAAWTVHCAQTGADPDHIEADDIETYEGNAGLVFRDTTPIYGADNQMRPTP